LKTIQLHWKYLYVRKWFLFWKFWEKNIDHSDHFCVMPENVHCTDFWEIGLVTGRFGRIHSGLWIENSHNYPDVKVWANTQIEIIFQCSESKACWSITALYQPHTTGNYRTGSLTLPCYLKTLTIGCLFGNTRLEYELNRWCLIAQSVIQP
jgi:hypothetical protein